MLRTALKQPLPNKQIALMRDVSFSAAGYAVLIEDDALEKNFNANNLRTCSLWVQVL